MEWNPIGTTSASLGSALGQGLARPINQAMELLEKKKLMEIQNNYKNILRQQQEQALSRYVGPEVANLIVNMDPKSQNAAFSNLGALMNMQKQLGGQASMETPGLGIAPDGMQMQPELDQEMQGQMQQPMSKQEEVARSLGEALTPEHIRLAREKAERDKEKLALQKEQFQTKQDFAEKKFGYEQTKKFREETEKMGEEADHTLGLLGRQRKLNNNKNLPHPLQVQLLRTLGMEWALNPDAQEFAGLEKEFLKGARSIFGGRVTNFEMSQFLRGIPTLMQSKEGRDRIIRNLEIMAKIKKLKADAAQDILAKSKFPPANLDQLVANKTKKKRDQLLNDFVTGGDTLKVMPNPEGNENKLLKDSNGNWFRSNGKKWKPISQEELDALTGGV